jgi:hypothetical protein
MSGPVTTANVAFLIGSPGWIRDVGPPKYPRQPRRECWRPADRIPDRAEIHRRTRELLDQARRTIADAKPIIQAMLRAA